MHACPLDLCGAKETPTTRQLITGARILRMRTRRGHRDKAFHPEGHTNNTNYPLLFALRMFMTLYMYVQVAMLLTELFIKHGVCKFSAKNVFHLVIGVLPLDDRVCWSLFKLSDRSSLCISSIVAPYCLPVPTAPIEFTNK